MPERIPVIRKFAQSINKAIDKHPIRTLAGSNTGIIGGLAMRGLKPESVYLFAAGLGLLGISLCVYGVGLIKAMKQVNKNTS